MQLWLSRDVGALHENSIVVVRATFNFEVNSNNAYLLGSVWPCYCVKDGSTMTNDAIPIDPVRMGSILDANGDKSPMYLIGFYMGEPVYRTTHALANGELLFIVFI